MKKFSLVLIVILILNLIPLQPSADSDYSAVPQVAVGLFHTAALSAYGRVYSTEISFVSQNDSYDFGQCNTFSWRNIVQIAAGEYFTAGLTSDGRVLFTGLESGSVKLPSGADYEYSIDVSGWENIVYITAGVAFVAGITADGTVLVSGCTQSMDVSEWTDITKIAAGDFHLVALKSDATCVGTGINYFGNANLTSYKKVKDIFAGANSTMLLFKDGTLRALGQFAQQYNENGDATWAGTGWTDITCIATGTPITGHMIAADSSGKFYTDAPDSDSAYASFKGVKNVIALDMGYARGNFQSYPFGVILKADGTLVASGMNFKNRAAVSSWNLFEKPLTTEPHRQPDVAVGIRAIAVLTADRMFTHTGENAALDDFANYDIIDIDAFPYGNHFAALTSSGTVISTNPDYDLSKWTGIVKVSVGKVHIAALRWDGTVLSTNSSDTSIYNTNTADIHSGFNITVTVSKQGDMHISSWDSSAQSPYSDFVAEDWKNARQISVGHQFIAGISSAGEMLFTGVNTHGEGDFNEEWDDVVAISAGWRHVLGIKADRSVVATGSNSYAQCDVSVTEGAAVVAAGNVFSLTMVNGPALVLSTDYDHPFDLDELILLPTEYINISDHTVSDGQIDYTVDVLYKTPGTYRVFVVLYRESGTLASTGVAITQVTITGDETEPISIPVSMKLPLSYSYAKALMWSETGSPVVIDTIRYI